MEKKTDEIPMQHLTCASCGEKFITAGAKWTKYCPDCRRKHRNCSMRALMTEQRRIEREKKQPVSYAEIRRRNRKRKVEDGWRGQKVAGGGTAFPMRFY